MNVAEEPAPAGEPPSKINKDPPRLRDREIKCLAATARDVGSRMPKKGIEGRSGRFTETSWRMPRAEEPWRTSSRKGIINKFCRLSLKI